MDAFAGAFNTHHQNLKPGWASKWVDHDGLNSDGGLKLAHYWLQSLQDIVERAGRGCVAVAGTAGGGGGGAVCPYSPHNAGMYVSADSIGGLPRVLARLRAPPPLRPRHRRAVVVCRIACAPPLTRAPPPI